MRRARLVAAWILWGALVVGTIGWLTARRAAEPRSLDERVTAIAQTLRCPVCRDLSVAASPSEIARQMRSSIAARLRAGESADQIRADFVRAYGQWILLSPPARGFGLLVWLAPFVALMAGGLLVVRTLRDRAPPATIAPDATLSPDDRRILEQALANPVPGEDR